MPRLRQRELQELAVKHRTTVTEADGTASEGWEEAGHAIKAKVQPASGRLLAEMYGQRLSYMLTLYAESGSDIGETDGVCVRSSAIPDYRVVAVRRWSGHLVADLEKVR